MKKLFLSILAVGFISCGAPKKDYKEESKTPEKNIYTSWSTVQNPEFIHRSIKKITDIMVHDIFSPPVASRIYAYCTVAGYEAIIPFDKNYISLAGQLHGLTPVPKPDSSLVYCFPLASVQAILKVGKALIFSEDALEGFRTTLMSEFKETRIPEDVFDRSVKYGTEVADHILAWSTMDNYKQTRSLPKYSIVSNPATWKPTPPAYMDAVEPHWSKIRTLVMVSAQQFRPALPTPFSTRKGSSFYKDGRLVFNASKNLTPEQREIAFFWDCNPFVLNVKGHVNFATKKISPGGHWINITRVACNQVKAPAAKCVEAYARVSISLMESFISTWDEKYRSKLIRPETYINSYIDRDWLPLLQTPPFPEYPSGHSVVSAAAAVTLTELLGEDFAYTDSTEVEFGLPPRQFKSFLQASEEAAISRVYGGIHYLPACVLGKKQGREIGNFIIEKIKTRSAN